MFINSYNYFTFDSYTLNVTVRGGQFYKGRLGISRIARPFQSDGEKNIYGLSQFPTIHFDPTLDSEKTMVCSRTDVYPKLTTYDSTDCIYIYPIVPLESDALATPSSLTVEVYAHFTGFKLLNQVVSGGLSTPTVAIQTIPLLDYVPAIFQGPEEESVAKTKKGVISSTLDSVSGIAGAVSKLPVVGTAAGVISTVASIGSAIASAFGFSRPAIMATPEMSVVRSIPYANTFGAISTADVLSCEAQSTLSTDPRLVGDVADHTNIYQIASTPSLIRKDVVLATYSPLDLVCSFGVTPCTSAVRDSPTLNHTQPSNIGYASSFFKLWSGDINYTFDFVSSPNQTLKVAICWTPILTLSWNATLRQQQFYIQGSQKVDFNVPWEHINASQLCGISTGKNNPINDGNYSNGYISIFVMQPISNALASNPTSISFLTYQSCGESFQLIGPRSLGLNPFTMQGVNGSDTVTKPSGIYSEEKVESLRELAKKHIYDSNIMPTATLPVSKSWQPLQLPIYLRYLLSRFTYMRGDLNMRLYHISNGDSDYPIYVTDGGVADSYRIYIDPKRESQYEITLRLLARSGFRATNAAEGAYSVNFALAGIVDGTSSSWDVYLSFDDTLSLGVLRCSPVLVFPPAALAGDTNSTVPTPLPMTLKRNKREGNYTSSVNYPQFADVV